MKAETNAADAAKERSRHHGEFAGSLRASAQRFYHRCTAGSRYRAQASLTATVLFITLEGVEAFSPSLELPLSSLYVFPVGLLTWFRSRRAGVILAIVSATVSPLLWLRVMHVDLAVAIWNAATRAGILILVVCLLAALRAHARRETEAMGEFFALLRRQRDAVAFELHDGLTQLLTATALKLKHVERQLAREGSVYSAETDEIVKLINKAVGQAREIARGLSPMDADARELVSALRHLSSTIARDFDVRCELTTTHEQIHCRRDAGAQIYRIVQQAIDNGVRHGHAEAVTIAVERDECALRVTIADNGCGFAQVDTPESRGLGLRSMSLRAEYVGGTLEVASTPGEGTSVTLVAPLPALLEEPTPEGDRIAA